MNTAIRNDILTHWQTRYEEYTQELERAALHGPMPDNWIAMVAMREAIWRRIMCLKFVRFAPTLVIGELPTDRILTIPVLYHGGCGDCS